MTPIPQSGNGSSTPVLHLPVAPRILIGMLVLVLITVAWELRRQGIWDHPENLLKTASDHTYSAIGIFLLVYALTTAAGIPTLPFNLAAGWIWGPLAGGALSALAASTGATLAFTAARTLFGQPLRKSCDSRFLTWAQEEFERKGWRFVAFIRLNPVFPTGPLNYFFGLTSIPSKTYICATAIALTPPSIAVAWIGGAVAHLRSGVDASQIMHVAMMISAGVTLLVCIRYGARYLNYSRSKRIP